ncbi:MAG: TIGR04219 family outer membrane beta-barrel protein [Thermodesulfobacteriota bacterium]
MKVWLIIISMLAILPWSASTARADIFRLEFGIGFWQTDPSGTITHNSEPGFDVDDTGGFSDKDEYSPFLWAYLKHPVPLVPNVRLELLDIDFSGSINQPLAWNGTEYDSGRNELMMNQASAAFYYNLLDNSFWLTLDLGLDFNYLNGDYRILPDDETKQGVHDDFSMLLPMLYVRTRAEILETGLAVEAIGRGIGYSGTAFYDFQIKADYSLNLLELVAVGFELGYRFQSIDLNFDDHGMDAIIDTDFAGFFSGVCIRF